jgi:hypothetical protein
VGFEPRTFSKNISWTLIPFHWAKCPIEKNSAPPEMAGVPLPTCSGVRAIMIHNKGPQFSSSIPSPMEKTGIFKYINYYFITCQILNIYKSRFFKVTYTQNGGLFSFSFCSKIIY